MDRRAFCHQLIGAGVVTGFWSSLAEAAPAVSATSGADKVHWQKSLKSALKMALQQNKPMMIVFGANWCSFCRKLNRETLADKRVAGLIEREFIPVYLDFDKEAKIAKVLEVERLPCTVFLTPQADLLLRTEGYANAKDFQAAMTNALEKKSEIQQVRGAGSPR